MNRFSTVVLLLVVLHFQTAVFGQHNRKAESNNEKYAGFCKPHRRSLLVLEELLLVIDRVLEAPEDIRQSDRVYPFKKKEVIERCHCQDPVCLGYSN